MLCPVFLWSSNNRDNFPAVKSHASHAIKLPNIAAVSRILLSGVLCRPPDTRGRQIAYHKDTHHPFMYISNTDRLIRFFHPLPLSRIGTLALPPQSSLSSFPSLFASALLPNPSGLSSGPSEKSPPKSIEPSFSSSFDAPLINGSDDMMSESPSLPSGRYESDRSSPRDAFHSLSSLQQNSGHTTRGASRTQQGLVVSFGTARQYGLLEPGFRRLNIVQNIAVDVVPILGL